MKLTFAYIFVFILTHNVCNSQNGEGKGSKAGIGNCVPDEKTAIAIAEAVWIPVFGDKIQQNKPFRAQLNEGKYWMVKGTLHIPKSSGDTIVIVKGGVPHIKIRKSDGRIESVYHTK